ncbi:hypothetical protein [Providencia hangzhouensis]|uniref:hypothetical protein n=1 Tax=Providencia hangzhouensis TaxID=3031799 RepID=UPI0034DD3055
MVDNVAQTLATKLAGDAAPLIMPHIKSRLSVEEGKTRVVDSAGHPSAFTIDDLEKEFRSNQLFAPVIIGSKATGTGEVKAVKGSHCAGGSDKTQKR